MKTSNVLNVSVYRHIFISTTIQVQAQIKVLRFQVQVQGHLKFSKLESWSRDPFCKVLVSNLRVLFLVLEHHILARKDFLSTISAPVERTFSHTVGYL